MANQHRKISGAEIKVLGKGVNYKPKARFLVLAFCIIVAILMLSPFLLMLLNAFKSGEDYTSNGPLSLPTEFYWGGVTKFWTITAFQMKLINSILISLCVAIGAAFLSLLNAYAIGVGRVKGRVTIIMIFMIANMIPQEALIYPIYKMYNDAHLTNTRTGIILIFVIINSAFGTYLLSSVLGTFPPSLLEAARLDGAGKWTILWKVVYPVVKPTVFVLVVFFFIWTWNEFFIPLVMLTKSEVQTVPIALSVLQGDKVLDVPTANAGALFSILPTIIFFFIFQRTLTKGITAGAVK